MAWEGDNDNDEYYVPIQTISGSIEKIKNELANVSIFKATMDHMYLKSHNFDDGSIELADPRIIAAETSQKDNLH